MAKQRAHRAIATDGRAVYFDEVARHLPTLIFQFEYLLLCGIGLITLQTGDPRNCSSSTPNECSIFIIDRILVSRLQTTVTAALKAVITATEKVVPNWG